MADDNYYPDEWKVFCGLVKDGTAPASSELSRFAARYRAAGNFQRAEFFGMSGDVCDGYSAVIKNRATLSAAVLSQLLRRDLGFQGLVVTDALVMEAITAHHGAAEAAVLAFEAGADLILMPADANAAIDGLLAAVQAGRISAERLEASLERRRLALARCVTGSHVGAAEAEPQPPTGLGCVLNDLEQLISPEELDLSRELLQLSLEVPGEGAGSPSTPSAAAGASLPPGPGLNLIRLDTQLNAPQLPAMAPALLRPAAVGYRATVLEIGRAHV